MTADYESFMTASQGVRPLLGSGLIWRGRGRSSPAEQKRRAVADTAPC
jgi:hypothetical protein